MSTSVLTEFPIPKTPIELYRLLKQCEKRNPLTKEVNNAPEGGLGEFQEVQMRAWLKENRGASAGQFVDWIGQMADKWNHDHTRPFCKVGEIAEGTLRRVVNIMNGRPQYYGQRQRPGDWDDEIDGTFDSTQRATAPGAAMLRAKQLAEQGVETTAMPGTQSTETPVGRIQQVLTPVVPAGPTGNVQQVLTPVAPEASLGPPDMTPAGPQGGQNQPSQEPKHAPYRGPGQKR